MSKPVILYMEDDEFSRDIMGLLFEDLPQYELIMFADSANFQDKLQHLPEQLSVILLDIHMEPFDGFEMIDMIRHYQPFAHLPVLALTASVMSEEITKLRTSGFDGAIAKPIDQDMFAEQIEAVLNHKLVWTV